MAYEVQIRVDHDAGVCFATIDNPPINIITLDSSASSRSRRRWRQTTPCACSCCAAPIPISSSRTSTLRRS